MRVCQSVRTDSAQRVVVARLLRRREPKPVALLEQDGDVTLAVENTLALHLGRMRGEHRDNQRGRKKAAQRCARYTAVQRSLDGMLHAALLRRRTGKLVRAVTPITMQILGNIAELGKIGKCPGHRYGRIEAQSAER